MTDETNTEELAAAGTGELGQELAGYVRIEEHEALVADRDRLVAENEKMAAALVKAKEEAKVARKPSGPRARKIGPVANALDPDALGELLGEGEWEIAFSDGRKEILGLDPVTVQGAEAWSRRDARWLLKERILLNGPAIGNQPYEIVGLGLFDPHGKQVAWGELIERVVVRAGSQTELRDTVLF